MQSVATRQLKCFLKARRLPALIFPRVGARTPSSSKMLKASVKFRLTTTSAFVVNFFVMRTGAGGITITATAKNAYRVSRECPTVSRLVVRNFEAKVADRA